MAPIDFKKLDSRTECIEGLVDIPQYIHHYSTFDGINGIISSNELWATRFCSTNDSSEFKYGHALLEERLRCGNFFSSAARRDRILADFFTRMKMRHKPSIFIVSFASEPDLLTHWREYAADASGGMLTFESRFLQDGLIAKGVSGPPAGAIFLQKIVYDRRKQQELADRYCRILAPTLEYLYTSAEFADEHTLSLNNAQLAGRFYRMAAQFKRSEFSYEKEIRLSVILLTHGNNLAKSQFGIRCAYTKSDIPPSRPYFRISKPVESNCAKNQKLKINRLLVAPSASKYDEERCHSLMEECGHEALKNYRSKIPYVGRNSPSQAGGG